MIFLWYILIRFSLLHLYQDLSYLSIHSTATFSLSLVNRQANKQTRTTKWKQRSTEIHAHRHAHKQRKPKKITQSEIIIYRQKSRKIKKNAWKMPHINIFYLCPLLSLLKYSKFFMRRKTSTSPDSTQSPSSVNSDMKGSQFWAVET